MIFFLSSYPSRSRSDFCSCWACKMSVPASPVASWDISLCRRHGSEFTLVPADLCWPEVQGTGSADWPDVSKSPPDAFHLSPLCVDLIISLDRSLSWCVAWASVLLVPWRSSPSCVVTKRDKDTVGWDLPCAELGSDLQEQIQNQQPTTLSRAPCWEPGRKGALPGRMVLCPLAPLLLM